MDCLSGQNRESHPEDLCISLSRVDSQKTDDVDINCFVFLNCPSDINIHYRPSKRGRTFIFLSFIISVVDACQSGIMVVTI